MNNAPRTNALHADSLDSNDIRAWWSLAQELEEELASVKAERDAAMAKAKSADDDANMYARAWQRELGPWMRGRHHIDACVKGTRDLRAAAEDHGRQHCCGQPEYCGDHTCAVLLRSRLGMTDAARKERE